MKLLSRVPLFATPWPVAYQASSVHRIYQARILERVGDVEIGGSGEISEGGLEHPELIGFKDWVWPEP